MVADRCLIGPDRETRATATQQAMNCAQRSHGRARRHPARLGRCMSRTTPRSKRMRIGIIGAGHIGGTLARELTELGDQVRVANSRGPASLASLAHETGARAVAVEDAVRDVQLVIVTIPQKSVPELSKGCSIAYPKTSSSLTLGTTIRRGAMGASKRSSAARPSRAG